MKKGKAKRRHWMDAYDADRGWVPSAYYRAWDPDLDWPRLPRTNGKERFPVDFTFVTDRVATGGGIWTEADVATLRVAGITHVVTAAEELHATTAGLLEGRMPYLLNGVKDDGLWKGAWWFAKTLDFAREALADPDAKVYLHCFPTGTLVGGRVPMPIESVSPMSLVTGADGRLHRVSWHHVHDFDGDLVQIGGVGFRPIRCTDEHPLLVLRPYVFPGGGTTKPEWGVATSRVAAEHYAAEPRWRTAAEVQPGDFLVAPRPTWGRGIEMWWDLTGHPNEVEPGPLNPSAEVAWLLGNFAADGSVSRNGVQVTTSRMADAERLVGAWTSLGLKAKVVDHGTYQRVSVASRAVARTFNMAFRSGGNRRLPAFVLGGDWPLADVLAGYVAGDGSRRPSGEVRCTTISEVLAEQVRSIAVGLGHAVTVRPIRRATGYPNAKPSIEVRWTESAHHRTGWAADGYLMPVTSVSRAPYKGQVHNLEVEGVETYTVNGATVHNCWSGKNRGPSAAYAVLRDLGYTPGAAESLIRKARPKVILLYRRDADEALQRMGVA